MNSVRIFGLLLLCHHCLASSVQGKCKTDWSKIQSERNNYYTINATLDHSKHQLKATQHLTYINRSSDTIFNLHFYMYLNSFKNDKSSFLKGTNEIFGAGYKNRKPEEWGWITIHKITRINNNKSIDLSHLKKYIQPNDGNIDDESVLEITLDKPILPGEKANFELEWQSQMPKTIARMGYNQNFYLFCHWYPQLGVWEKNKHGKYAWNCHQAFRNTEFYGDFGNYDVSLTIDSKFKIGSSGCLISSSENKEGTKTYHFHGEDLIDFAWSIDFDLIEFEDYWEDVYIHLLVPCDYYPQANSYLKILKFALDYMKQHVEKYPYPSITVVCPPFHALRSGLMEYPSLITTGSFYGFPENIKLNESLLVHEFVHQYFMATIASNEKEEPWMDEGFATFYEDRIIDAAYPGEGSIFNWRGFKMDNKSLTRQEYVGMDNPAEGIVNRPGWEFQDHNYKGLIYSKTATSLHSISRILGASNFDKIIKDYYATWKFKHPRGEDFLRLFKNKLPMYVDSVTAMKAYDLFYTTINEKKILDYAINNIENEKLDRGYNSKIELSRLGDWIVPVDIEIIFEDNSKRIIQWNGQNEKEIIKLENSSKVISAYIDPEQKILLDTNLNNNSLTIQQDNFILYKWSLKCLYWIQHIIQILNFL